MMLIGERDITPKDFLSIVMVNFTLTSNESLVSFSLKDFVQFNEFSMKDELCFETKYSALRSNHSSHEGFLKELIRVYECYHVTNSLRFRAIYI